MKLNSRTAIVDAAVTCAEVDGWESTSMQAVRERAGVSNGTLFHHFPSRQALANAVVAAGLADHQHALLEVLNTTVRADDAVRITIVRHLRWIEDNPQLARLLLATPPDALRASLDPRAVAANRGFFASVAVWLGSQGWPGTPELPVVLALWIGPAQEYARGWLTALPGDLAPPTPLAGAATALAEGAWQALRPLLRQENS